MESDRDGAVMHIPEAGVYFGEGQAAKAEKAAAAEAAKVGGAPAAKK